MPAVVTAARRRAVAGAFGAAVVTAMLVSGLVTGCGNGPGDEPPAGLQPAVAAVAPAPSSTPAGAIRALPGHPRAALVDSASSALVVLGAADSDDRDMLTVLASGPVEPRTILLPAAVTALAGDDRGNALLATRGGYFTAGLATGTIAKTEVAGQQDTDFTAVARRSDGRVVLGGADGSVFTLTAPSALSPGPSSAEVARREKVATRVDAIVTQADTAVVLDRSQTSVTSVDSDGTVGQALRAGEGATTMTTDPAGRVLVADTRGGELLVFGVDPLILRQRYPVHDSPYGVAGSAALAWVSQTASNVVIGYDLATGIPVEKVRYQTVQQPNILAYDDASGTLYVVSGSGAGVQAIEHADNPR